MTNCTYRVSAKALIRNGEGKLLFVEEKQNNGHELPGGGIENGENHKDALRRELEEELGVKAKDIADAPIFVWIINHDVMWLIFEVELESEDFKQTHHIESFGFFDITELESRTPNALGYCCNLNKKDLENYLK